MVNMKISTRRWSANLVFLLIYSGFHWQFVNAFTDTILQGQSFITSLIRENDLILHKICYIPIRFHKIRKYSCKYMQICFQYLYFKPFLFYRITLFLFILYIFDVISCTRQGDFSHYTLFLKHLYGIRAKFFSLPWLIRLLYLLLFRLTQWCICSPLN